LIDLRNYFEAKLQSTDIELTAYEAFDESNRTSAFHLRLDSMTRSQIVAFFGSLECMVILNQYITNINQITSSQYSPIDYAILSGSKECVSFLYLHGANLTEIAHGQTLLYYAAQKRSSKILQFLFDNGAFNKHMDSAILIRSLKFAIQIGNIKILSVLFRNFSSICKLIPNMTLLEMAIRIKNPFILREILKHENPNLPNIYHDYPLFLAIRQNYFEGFEILLQHGAKVDIIGPDELTVIDSATQAGNLAIIKKLLEVGCNPHIGDINVRRAISFPLKSEVVVPCDHPMVTKPILPYRIKNRRNRKF
jgi:ankyrin repeat protein